LLQEKLILQLEQIVLPSEMKIKGLMWRSADKIKKNSSQKGTASTSNLRSDKSGGNGGGGGSGDGDDIGGNGNGGNGDGDSRRVGGNGSNIGDIVMGEIGGNQQHWERQLAAWKTEAVEGAKEASLISGDGESLTSRHLSQLTSSNIVEVV
jgi:hypothetical protein